MAKDPLISQDEQQRPQDLTCKTVSSIVDTYYNNVNYYERREARNALRTIMKNCYLPGILQICQFADVPFSPGSSIFKMMTRAFHRRQLKTCVAYSSPPWAKRELFIRALTNVLQVCVAVDYF